MKIKDLLFVLFGGLSTFSFCWILMQPKPMSDRQLLLATATRMMDSMRADSSKREKASTFVEAMKDDAELIDFLPEIMKQRER